MSTAEQPRDPAELVEVAEQRASPAPGYWIFTATSRPSLQHRAVHLADRRRGRRLVVELGERLAPVRAEVLGQDRVHRAGRQRRSRLLQLGQGRPVRAGDLRREGGLEDRQRLPELHRAALELAEHAEDLVGRAAAGSRRRRARRAAADPLAQAQCGPAGQSNREGRQLCRARDRSAGQIVHNHYCRSQSTLPATATAIMPCPGPPPPLPIRQDEFQRAVGHSAGRCGPVDEGEGLRGSLGGHRRRQHGVAGGWIRAAAGELSEDERPGGIALGPGHVEAPQRTPSSPAAPAGRPRRSLRWPLPPDAGRLPPEDLGQLAAMDVGEDHEIGTTPGDGQPGHSRERGRTGR